MNRQVDKIESIHIIHAIYLYYTGKFSFHPNSCKPEPFGMEELYMNKRVLPFLVCLIALFGILLMTGCEIPSSSDGDDNETADKTALASALTDANTLNTAHEAGTDPGDVSQEDKDDFTDIIALAQIVYDNSAATQQEVDDALDMLEAASLAFQLSIIQNPDIDKDTLITTITEANALNDDHAVGSADGNVPQGAKDTFEAAIAAAETIRDDYEATQDEVDDAVTALAAAMTSFEEAVIEVEPEPENLIINGNFTTDNTGWGFWSGNGSVLSNESGAAQIVVTDVGGDWWTTQFWHGTVDSPNTVIPAEGDYTISFTANASVARDLRLEITVAEAAATPTVFDFALGTTPQTYQATIHFSGLGGAPKFRLNFGTGKISDNSVPATITIDNVSIETQTSALTTDTLTINVTDGSDPVEGATVSVVTISPGNAGNASTLSNASGDAEFAGLELRQYAYAVTMDGYVSATGVVDMNTSTTTNAVITLIPTRTDSYLYSTAGTVDIANTLTNWGSGSTVSGNYTSDTTYNPCIESTLTNPWGDTREGFVAAFTGYTAGSAAGFDNLKFKIKCDGLTTIFVKFPGATGGTAEQIEFSMASVATEISDDWYEVTLPLAQWGDLGTNAEVAILTFQEGLAANAYITDVYFDVTE
jgi:hypothetical protein